MPSAQAQISVQTHAFNYGTGCFEGIRAYVSRSKQKTFILHLLPHLRRFVDSCKILGIGLNIGPEELAKRVVELARRNQNGGDFYIRPLAYKSHTRVGIYYPDQTDDFVVFSVPFGNYLEVERGIRVMVSSFTRIEDNMVPARSKCTGMYINSFLAKAEAARHGYDEAIFLDRSGHVCEGSAENIFIVRDGKLHTPGVSSDILEGVTRQSVIELAGKELGIECVERPLDRSELYIADEVFLCGTGAQISPVVEVDGRKVGPGVPGKLTQQLQTLYFGIVRGDNVAYRAWLTEVPPA